MHRIIPAALALAAAVPAPAAERGYSVTDFDRIVVEGPFAVKLVTGKGPSARASGSSAAIERVSVDVQGRTLRIRSNSSAWGGFPGEGAGPTELLVTTHDLRSARLSGSGSLDIDKVEGMRFEAALSGSGSLSLGAVEADVLLLGAVGSGMLEVGGKAKKLQLIAQGAATIEGAGLAVEDAEVNAATSGEIALGVRRTVRLTTSGAGNVEIIGSPACTVKATGAGLVRCGD
jgi:hypothetical protein